MSGSCIRCFGCGITIYELAINEPAPRTWWCPNCQKDHSEKIAILKKFDVVQQALGQISSNELPLELVDQYLTICDGIKYIEKRLRQRQKDNPFATKCPRCNSIGDYVQKENIGLSIQCECKRCGIGWQERRNEG